MMSFQDRMRYMNPYDIHKAIINEYILKRPGDTKLIKRDSTKDRTDLDVLKDNHRFLWGDDQAPDTWEEQFAKKYYDKLFKEYCIADLTLYKENKVRYAWRIALRWRIEKEVVIGKGHFICGNKRCEEKEGLKSWEVNFGYVEKGEKRNALVKIRLCENCSKKLNYHTKKREVKRLKKKKYHKSEGLVKEKGEIEDARNDMEEASTSGVMTDEQNEEKEESLWANLKPVEVKTREEEMEEYLQDLLL